MITIIQFRNDKSAEHDSYCFDKHLDKDHRVLSIYHDSEAFKNPDEIIGGSDKIIIGGSGDLYLAADHGQNDEVDYSKAMITPLLDRIFEYDIPTLGICYGHQLIADHMGGRISLLGAESGDVDILFTPEGRRDPLLAGISNPFPVISAHKDSVSKLPETSVKLARSVTSENQVLRYQNNIYGVQFHCELDEHDYYERMKIFPQYVIDPEKELKPILGPQLLQNFVNM